MALFTSRRGEFYKIIKFHSILDIDKHTLISVLYMVDWGVFGNTLSDHK